MTIRNIPLDQLELSPLNVRKTRTKEAVANLAANIAAEGLLQNLIVSEPTEEGARFGVVIGGIRLASLQLPVKQKKIEADHPVRCPTGE